MAMMAYKASVFMIVFNYAMVIANFISGYIFPDTSTQVGTWNGEILTGTSVFAILSTGDVLQILALTAGVLALFAFSLLIPTIPFVFTFFALSGFISESYLWQLPIPMVFKLPLSMMIAIIFYTGASQYAARSSFSGS